jgi:hypothetical protein
MGFEGVDWIHLDQDRGPWHALVYIGMAFLFSIKGG